MSTISATFADTRAPAAAPQPEAIPSSGPVRIDRSLVDLACLGDEDALQTIIHQFIGADERIDSCEYLGTLGIPPFGRKSFAVITPRRVGTLRVGWLGFVEYQDAPIEYTVSAVIKQPSKLELVLWLAQGSVLMLIADFFLFAFLGAWSWFGLLALLVAPLGLAIVWLVSIRFYYAFRKCGILWAVREGLSVYAFTNRGRMNLANRLHRRIFELREQRLRELAPLP
jgi:hypothetical protein